MTETPYGRDGTSAADRASDPAQSARDTGDTHSATRDRPRRPRPQPIGQGLPPDTLALLLLLVVIILVLSLGAFIVR